MKRLARQSRRRYVARRFIAVRAMNEISPMTNEPSPLSQEELLVRIRLLEEQQRVVAGFLSALTIELKTPLNAMLGMSQLLLDGFDGSLTDTQTKDVEFIQRKGQDLQKLLDKLLSSSRLMQPSSYEWDAVEPSKLVDQYFRHFRGSLVFNDGCPKILLAVNHGLLIETIRLIVEAFGSIPGKPVRLDTLCNKSWVSLKFSSAGQRLSDDVVKDFSASSTKSTLLDDWFSEIYNLRFAAEVAKRHGGELEIIHEPKTDTVIVMRLPIYTDQSL